MGRKVWVPVVSGPLAPYAAGFWSWLASRAYSRSAAADRLYQFDQLSRWLAREGLGVGEMTGEQFEFVMAIETYKKVNKRLYPTWTEILEVLKERGACFAGERIESANVRVCSFQRPILGDAKRIHRAHAFSNAVEARTMGRHRLFVRNGHIAAGPRRDEPTHRVIERARRHVDRLVDDRQAGVPERSILQRGGERMCYRVSDQDETTRCAFHDRPGARSAAMRSMACCTSRSSSSNAER